MSTRAETVSSVVKFGGLNIRYDDQVLRPRLWTLAQANWAAELLETAPAGPVLELCAGVGHLGLAATAETDRDLVLVDLNPTACEFARVNAAAAGMAHRVVVREGLIDAVLADDENFSLIMADPPWVPSSEIAVFPEDPPLAIDGGADGLDLARTCVGLIDKHLTPDGVAILQLGSNAQVGQMVHFLTYEVQSEIGISTVRTFEDGVLVQLSR